MLYLLNFGWPWFAAAGALGLAVGFVTATRGRDGAFSGRWVVLLAILLLACAGAAVSQNVVAGRNGLVLEIGFLMSLVYFLGLPLGGGAKGLMPAPVAVPERPTPVILRGSAPAAEQTQEAAQPAPEEWERSSSAEAEPVPEASIAAETPRAVETPHPTVAPSPIAAPSPVVAPSPIAAPKPIAAPSPAVAAGVIAAKPSPLESRSKSGAPSGKSLPGRAPQALAAPRGGAPDDLSRIKGIGPKSVEKLHALGVYHFDQIAAWTPDEAHYVGAALSVPGRVERGKWVQQARALVNLEGEKGDG